MQCTLGFKTVMYTEAVKISHKNYFTQELKQQVYSRCEDQGNKLGDLKN